MQNRTVLVILAVAVALLAFILLVERETMTTSERQSREDRVFGDFRQELVERLTVEPSTGEGIVLQREAGPAGSEEDRWRITAPRELRADASTVRSLLSALDYLLRDRAVTGAPKQEDPRYGLASPRLSGSFTIREKTTSFRIGADAQGEKVYLAIDGLTDEFYAVDRDFLESMDQDLDSLRDKHLLRASLTEATGLVLRRGSETIELKREGLGPWRIAKGDVWVQAQADQVNELLRMTGNLRAIRFVADGEAAAALDRFGLGAPRAQLEVGLADGDPVQILIGSPCDEGKSVHLTVSGSGEVACTDQSLLELLTRPRARLQEMRLAVFGDDEVVRVVLERGPKKLTLNKEEAGWSFVQPDSVGTQSPPVEPQAISELFSTLRDTRGEGVVWGSAALQDLGRPAAVVQLGLSVPPSELVLELYRTADGDRVRRRGEQAALLVPAGFVDSVPTDLLAYRLRHIANGDQGDIEEIRLEGPASSKLIKEDGLWKIAEPLAIAADGAAVRTLSGKLADLQVTRYAAKETRAEHGLARPWATATTRFVALQGEGEQAAGSGPATVREIVLQLGSQAPEGGRYARQLGDDPVVFVVDDQYFAEALSHPLAARDLLQLSPADLVELELASGADKVALVKTKEQWTRQNGAPLEGETLPRLVTDLGALKAIRADSFGPAPAGFASPVLVVTARTATQKDAGEAEQITVGPTSPRAEDQGYLARRRGLEITFVIPARLVDDLVRFTRETASR